MSKHTQKAIDDLAQRYSEHMHALRARLDYIMADEATNRPDLTQLDEAARLDVSIKHMRRYDAAVAAAFSAFDLAVAIDRREPGYLVLPGRGNQ
ncbi:hypothetical protein BOC59_20615 [Burkholderia pseudomallei]|nr:hypothetical protein [Burkholderia pseudomallei]ARM02103.1 hypothetical protein BOC59_20615 [Burkholderia pseudomallei]